MRAFKNIFKIDFMSKPFFLKNKENIEFVHSSMMPKRVFTLPKFRQEGGEKWDKRRLHSIPYTK